VELDGDGGFTVESKAEDGTFVIRFDQEDVLSILERSGKIPLPPYINREPEAADKERYQTVYAKVPGAVAAPTAGLHFTNEILQLLENKGVTIVRLTLHVGAGTFKPVSVQNVEDHVMHEEAYSLSPEAAAAINHTHDIGHRVFCVGTTTIRVLETCAEPATGRVIPQRGRTAIFLYPPYKPRVADALLTNFHLPQSTLIMLVSTFSDLAKVKAAYQYAIEQRMRFFSYGDCMLLLPDKP
jgi:S-adenosylmethionine:tRNA ribosyltransferase-isomerase